MMMDNYCTKPADPVLKDDGALQFLFCVLFYAGRVNSLYFHEKSQIIIEQKLEPRTNFGFSMTYQKGDHPSLVVGAPLSGRYGKVYSCPVHDIFEHKNQPCHEINIDFDKLADNDTWDDANPTQNFWLGASVSATEDYVFTCAPLWTAALKNGLTKGPLGICFIYNGTEAIRYSGRMEEAKLKNNSVTEAEVYGGRGWTMLTDDANDLTLISKPAYDGSVDYFSSTNPSEPGQIYQNFRWNRNNVGTSLAAGNFFTDYETVFACSLREYANGRVQFLRMVWDNEHKRKIMKLVKYGHNVIYFLQTHEGYDVGSMFGSALFSTRFNDDSKDDLLVGAPGHAGRDEGVENGAIYIFLGGTPEYMKESGKAIVSDQERSRFGSAIAASDIDGDKIPEIFVSAPNEGDNFGTLYVFSGYELKQFLFGDLVTKVVHTSQLQFTQRIHRSGVENFGQSLQVIPDVDNNGCDELAVGSPHSALVTLLWCMPAVTARVSVKYANDSGTGITEISEYDPSMTIAVCVEIDYNPNPTEIRTKLLVTTGITGQGVPAASVNPTYPIDLSLRNSTYCNDIIVKFDGAASGEYVFTANVSHLPDDIRSSTFDHNQVVLSPWSKMTRTLPVFRKCGAKDPEECKPHLDMAILWRRENRSQEVLHYTLGHSKTETFQLSFVNKGGSLYKSCVRLRVSGGSVSKADGCGREAGIYTCYLPTLSRRDERSMEFELNMNYTNNVRKDLHIEASLYYVCDADKGLPPSNITAIDVTFSLDTTALKLNGSSYSFNITDLDIEKLNSVTVIYKQDYEIYNTGYLSWKDLVAIVTLDKASFIQDTEVTADRAPCERLEQNKDSFVFLCIVELKPTTNSTKNSTLKIETYLKILKNKIAQNTIRNQLEVGSKVKISLLPTNETLHAESKTLIYYSKERTVGNNKTLIIIIAIIIAVLLLLIFVAVLYKIGFFKRKTKERLDTSSYKENIRKQSVAQGKNSTPEEDREDNFEDIEVIDDAFEVIERMPTTADDASLIVETKADVHS